MAKKKILIVSYYWPPAGGPGVQRWLKFAKYLPDFDWTPIIYTPENPSYPILDETLLKEVSDELTILKKPIWEPYRLAELLSKKNNKFKGGQFETQDKNNWKSNISVWIRGNFFIPDARKFWIRPSVKYLEKYLRENPIDALVTTGPPHSMHLIGLELKKIFPQLLWLADFRDPWTKISYYQHLRLTRWADARHKLLEKKVFQTADVTLATSPSDARNFKTAGANAYCITNGFDVEEELPQKTMNEYFTIAYIGVLEQLRNPSAFWQAIGELYSENECFKQLLRLKFVGRVDEAIIREIETILPKENRIDAGYLSHSESYKAMLSADVLLLTNFPKGESAGIIPGKLFEYLSTGNPIISVGPKQSDVANILEMTKSGVHFSYSEKEKMKTYLLNQFIDFQRENLKHRNVSPEVMAFSRKNLTEQLTVLLNEYSATR